MGKSTTAVVAGNYLRARGEYLVRGNRLVVPMELPPRTRRIPGLSCGAIATHVNYLRARGEYPVLAAELSLLM